MTLKLYDSLARETRDFVPRDPARVTLYVCGPTVYDYAHIGNARPAVVFDVLFRLLRRTYGENAVVYARNVTDVDDKINAKAAREGVPIGEITARYEAAYLSDMARLNVLAPTFDPHVTRHMDDIRAQIAALVARGAAYAAEGHVLFDVSSYPCYGALSGRSLEDMIAGARVEVAPYKRNPHDFVLWKPSKPGEPEWDSPWGPGRPGWHIECSAMIESVLGLPVDIHGGGVDLQFPHHENEIAQGVCAHGHDDPRAYARYWLHNGFLTIDSEKMSKSLGNVALLHDLVEQVPGEVVRWALLSAHYRQPLDWTGALLEQSRASLDKLYQALRDVRPLAAEGAAIRAAAPRQEGLLTPVDVVTDGTRLWPMAVAEALEDDLNTPRAMSWLFRISDDLRRAVSQGDAVTVSCQADALREAGAMLGVLQQDPDAWFEGGADDAFKAEVEDLIARRAAARAARDWAEADRIRDRLTEMGVQVMDGPTGATWRRV